MRPLLCLLLLAGLQPAAAQGGGQAPEGGAREPRPKQEFKEDPSLPKDQGWRAIGIGGSPHVEPDPDPVLAPKDVRANVLTLLETYLARTGGRWVIADAKSGRERSLRLAELGALKQVAPGRYAGPARFRDAAGAVQAELQVHLGGSRWRILSLEPAGAKKPASRKPAVEPDDVLVEAPDAKPPVHLPAPPPPDPNPPPSLMPTVPPGK